MNIITQRKIVSHKVFQKMPRVLFCPFQCVYALEFPLVSLSFFNFLISCAKTILNLVRPKLVDQA